MCIAVVSEMPGDQEGESEGTMLNCVWVVLRRGGES